MSNLDRDAVSAFQNEPWPWEKGIEGQAAVAGLPPLYMEGFEPSITDGRLTVAAGEASVDGQRVEIDETLITESHYLVNRIGSFSYYVYLTKSGELVVDIQAPRVNEDTRVLSHPQLDHRYIMYFELDSDRDVSVAHKALPSELSAGDLSNAVARDELAEQLGYTDYATMVTTVITRGSIVTAGGYLSADIIDSNTIVADMIAAGEITSEKLDTGAVTTDKIIAGGVTAEKLAANALAFPTEGLVAHYPLDDLTESDTVVDVSGNGNHGTKSGFGPVAWYKLDGDATDSSGNGYDGTASGPTYETGKVGQAARFDGTDDYISLPSGAYSVVDEASPWSFSAWAKLDTTSPADNPAAVIDFRDSTTNAATVQYQSSGTEWEVYAFNSTGYISGPTATTEWTHLAVTFDGSTVTLYVDGASAGADASVTPTGIVADSLAIGGRGDGPTALSFDGLIDEVRIYDYALSPDEVSALYTRPSAPAEAVDGVAGRALQFNGVDQYVDISSGIPAGDITVSMWFNAAKNTTNRWLFEQNGSGGSDPRQLYIDTSEIIRWKSERSDGTTNAVISAQPATWTADAWNNVVAIQDGTTTRIYVNGVLADEDTHADIYASFGADGELGSTGSLLWFDGLIDEVRIYNRALTATEVKLLYQFPGGIGSSTASAEASLAEMLGYADYPALVSAAQNGQTIIDGGYIRTELLETTVINAVLANINSSLNISDTLGYLASEGDGEADSRAYLTPTKLSLQQRVGGLWIDLLSAAVSGGAANLSLNGSIQVEHADIFSHTKSLSWGSASAVVPWSSTTADVRGIASNGTVVIAVGEESGITRSVNDGATWSASGPFTATYDCIAASGDTFIAGTLADGAVVRSTNAGVSWSAISIDTVTTNNHGIAASGDIWITVGSITSTSAPAAWRSTDDGATWTNISASLQSITWRPESVWASGTTWVIVGASTSEILRSSDGGSTWSKVTTSHGANLYAVRSVGSTWVAVGANGYGMRSTDDGATWSSVTLNIGSTYTVYGLHGTEDAWMAAARFNGTNLICRSEDDGATWTAFAVGGGLLRTWAICESNGYWIIGAENRAMYRLLLTVTTQAYPSGPYDIGLGVIDIGSNTSGSWVTFAAGLQVCWTRRNNTPSSLSSWTFPKAFDYTDIACVGNYAAGGGSSVFVAFGVPSATSVSWGSILMTSIPAGYLTTAQPHSLYAIGYVT